MSLAVLLNLALAAAGPPYAQLPRVFSPTATFQLKDGKQMPVMGLGVYMMKQGEETYNAAALAAATEWWNDGMAGFLLEVCERWSAWVANPATLRICLGHAIYIYIIFIYIHSIC